jgi:acyl-CoA synthetase (AMP-forming)/AMP-acid ligase II/acyl carrier protein
MCGAPNFAYDLCYKKITDDQLAELDLSTWRVAYNAAEPVNSSTLNNFTHRFGSCGFTANRFYPGYGMAEATVFITGGVDQEIPNIITVDKQCLANHKIKLIDKSDHHGTTLVSCGKAALPHDVRVVNPDTSIECPEGLVGEIWFSGPSVSPGYWQLAELSEQIFGQNIENQSENTHSYLRTGDLGVMWDSELYVTGRMKDLIILNGVNYYPQDIEESTVNAHQSVRAGYVAAFSIVEGGNEKLIIVTELERKFFRTVNIDLVVDAINKQVFEDHQISVDRVVLLKPYIIPKTSSGKIQRSQTRTLLLNDDLDVLADSNSLNEKEIITPNTKVEHLIHKIWCNILKKDSICVTDNFFDIGGDSIMAIEISAEIDKAYKQLSFDMDKLLELATVKDISQYIELSILHEERNLTTISTQSSGVLRI